MFANTFRADKSRRIGYQFRYGRESRMQREANARARVLPGSYWYAGGIGAGLRYRQPQNLSYQLPVCLWADYPEKPV